MIGMLEIVEKAYELNLDKISDGFHYSEIIVYSESRGTAKQKILNEINIDEYEIENVGKMIFLNMPIRRCKSADKVMYNGEILKRYQVNDRIKLNEHDEKFDNFLIDDTITHCYIRKNGSYYGWDMSGYTSYKYKAGVYLKEVAVNHCKGIIELECLPIDIEEHNEIILNEITRIKKGLII